MNPGNSKPDGTHKTSPEKRAAASEWQRKNPERAAAKMRAYRAKNREKMRAYEKSRLAARKAANPTVYRERNRVRSLKKYGLTIETWEVMFDLQGRRCAICRSDHSGNGRWHTDHNASIGLHAVRGILCVRCNIGIGQLDHDAGNLRAAVEYLEKHNG